MYVFLVILIFGKKIQLVQLEPKPNKKNKNRNTRFPNFFTTELFLFFQN